MLLCSFRFVSFDRSTTGTAAQNAANAANGAAAADGGGGGASPQAIRIMVLILVPVFAYVASIVLR